MSGFTREDAQVIIAVAQNAPLPNLRVAAQLSAALQRFREHVEATLPKDAAEADAPVEE